MAGAFIIGFLGSFHCVGMCGPIMLSLTKGAGNWSVFVKYHASRIAVYTIFGLGVGLLGAAFNTFKFQQWVSVISGLMLIAIYAFPRWRNNLERLYYQSAFYAKAKGTFLPMYQSKWKWFAAGALNGLLPCGLIYLALAGAMLESSMQDSALYMILFGLGTLPALIFVSAFRKPIQSLTRKFPAAITLLAMIAGFTLVLRGLLVHSPDYNSLITAQIQNVVTSCGF